MKRRILSLAVSVFAAALGPLPVQAYYHFIHYLKSGNAPEKFNLGALPNQTVTFYVSENGPTTYAPTDSFNSVLGQIEQAAQVWNGVGSSALRVAFGGLENPVTLQSTPGGDVSFEDLPPGVEGYGGPTTLATPVTAADGSQFFPIVRSVVHLNLNLNQPPGPSFDQSFLMTVIHEMGHALGLQHTFTSASMSQATTSATTLVHPLGADDIAGISVLYPNANFGQFGSITGTVTVGGKPVHLASVVALQAGQDAISAVTNPDGSFHMNGVPPGQYAVYVHTMPPDADIFGPWDASGNVVAASGAINSVFYPATTDYTQAAQITVSAGTATPPVNFQVTSRPSVPLYDGQVYGYFNNATIEVYPAPVTIAAAQTPVVASIVGLTPADVAALHVQVPGGGVSIASNGIVPIQSNGYTYAAVFLNFAPNAQAGVQHMILTTPDYMYVLPSAMYFTQTGPPTITGISSNLNGTFTVAGTNFTPTTQIYFDSLPAANVVVNAAANTATVTPPPGANGQTSTLVAYNPDGQNSQILQSASPVTYPYGLLPTPAITSIFPSSLPAGAEAMIDITGSGFSFGQGPTTIGFGTTDITVQRVFVLSPDHVQVDVSISPNASLGATDVSAISGFQLATSPAAFQITAAVAGLPAPYPVLVNALPGLTGSYAGAVVSLFGTNLSAPGQTPSVAIGGAPATILYASAVQINLAIPANLPPGPAALTLNNGAIAAFPVEVNIDTPPSGIVAVQNAAGGYVDSSSTAHRGDVLIVTLGNFAPGGPISPNRVQVSVGGVIQNATQVSSVTVGASVFYQVTFQLNATVPVGSTDPLIVYLDGRSSYPASIPVAAAPTPSTH